ncbi:hypothetical protein [Roseovarius salis]|uniref:hypothetical protein n=1 Tax=Roseovarius salis TaxID=3376063 RepID=UPI0037C57B29
MRRGNLQKAPDYTNAALIMGLVNLLWLFIAIRAAFGLAGVVAVAYGLKLLIDRIGRRG